MFLTILLNVYKYILFYIGDRVLPPAARLGRDPRYERLQGGLLLRKPRFRGGHEDSSTQEEQGGEEKQINKKIEKNKLRSNLCLFLYGLCRWPLTGF